MKDSRFDALFTSSDYALDPTDPRYKGTEGAKSIQKEAVSRRGAVPVIRKQSQGLNEGQLDGLSTRPQASAKGDSPTAEANVSLHYGRDLPDCLNN